MTYALFSILKEIFAYVKLEKPYAVEGASRRKKLPVFTGNDLTQNHLAF